MKNFKDLVMSIKDDIDDMEMLVEYTENAIESNDKELAHHFMYKLETRKQNMQRSHEIAKSMIHQKEHSYSEGEKMYKECLHELLVNSMEDIEDDIEELQEKM